MAILSPAYPLDDCCAHRGCVVSVPGVARPSQLRACSPGQGDHMPRRLVRLSQPALRPADADNPGTAEAFCGSPAVAEDESAAILGDSIGTAPSFHHSICAKRSGSGSARRRHAGCFAADRTQSAVSAGLARARFGAGPASHAAATVAGCGGRLSPGHSSGPSTFYSRLTLVSKEDRCFGSRQ